MKTALVALLMFYAGIAGADYSQVQEPAAKAASCSLLTTADECRQHREAMATMKDPVARATYLEWYADLLHERERLCGGAAKLQVLAGSAYR